MSILYDEGQQAIATESRRVLEARVSKDELLPLLEASGEYHTAFWETAKEQGWTALALPEAYGGLDLGLALHRLVETRRSPAVSTLGKASPTLLLDLVGARALAGIRLRLSCHDPSIPCRAAAPLLSSYYNNPA